MPPARNPVASADQVLGNGIIAFLPAAHDGFQVVCQDRAVQDAHFLPNRVRQPLKN